MSLPQIKPTISSQITQIMSPPHITHTLLYCQITQIISPQNTQIISPQITQMMSHPQITQMMSHPQIT